MKESGTTGVRKAGRPRKVREELPLELNEPTAEDLKEVVQPKEVEVNGSFTIQEIRGGKLPLFVYRGVEYIKKGENHVFCNGNEATGYKLIRVYISPRGRAHRSLERTFKPRKRTERGMRDRMILKKLKGAGVPGII